jgi:hypothetical protein
MHGRPEPEVEVLGLQQSRVEISKALDGRHSAPSRYDGRRARLPLRCAFCFDGSIEQDNKRHPASPD